MSSLPLYKTDNLQVDLLQTRWKSELDPVLANVLVQGQQISATLGPGNTAVNHMLGRMQQGWSIADISGPAVIWRYQPFNDTALNLTCSAVSAVTVYLWVW